MASPLQFTSLAMLTTAAETTLSPSTSTMSCIATLHKLYEQATEAQKAKQFETAYKSYFRLVFIYQQLKTRTIKETEKRPMAELAKTVGNAMTYMDKLKPVLSKLYAERANESTPKAPVAAGTTSTSTAVAPTAPAMTTTTIEEIKFPEIPNAPKAPTTPAATDDDFASRLSALLGKPATTTTDAPPATASAQPPTLSLTDSGSGLTKSTITTTNTLKDVRVALLSTTSPALIEARDLYALLNKSQESADQVLLLDVRPSDQAHASHMVHLMFSLTRITIAPTMLRNGIAAFQIEEALTNHTKKMFADRCRFQHVVIIAEDDTPAPLDPATDNTPATMLYHALWTYEGTKRLPKQPQLLHGGYATWWTQYPSLCSAKPRRQAAAPSALHTLKSTAYPTLPARVPEQPQPSAAATAVADTPAVVGAFVPPPAATMTTIAPSAPSPFPTLPPSIATSEVAAAVVAAKVQPLVDVSQPSPYQPPVDGMPSLPPAYSRDTKPIPDRAPPAPAAPQQPVLPPPLLDAFPDALPEPLLADLKPTVPVRISDQPPARVPDAPPTTLLDAPPAIVPDQAPVLLPQPQLPPTRVSDQIPDKQIAPPRVPDQPPVPEKPLPTPPQPEPTVNQTPARPTEQKPAPVAPAAAAAVITPTPTPATPAVVASTLVPQQPAPRPLDQGLSVPATVPATVPFSVSRDQRPAVQLRPQEQPPPILAGATMPPTRTPSAPTLSVTPMTTITAARPTAPKPTALPLTQEQQPVVPATVARPMAPKPAELTYTPSAPPPAYVPPMPTLPPAYAAPSAPLMHAVAVPAPRVDRAAKPDAATAGSRLSAEMRMRRLESMSGVAGGHGKALTGLRNLGNTCFMNSVLQCLSATVPLSAFFVSGRYRNQVNRRSKFGSKGEMAEEFGELMSAMWMRNYKYLVPRFFKDAVSRLAPQFAGSQQHDCQEFCSSLLDSLHEDLNQVREKPYFETPDVRALGEHRAAEIAWEQHHARENSPLVDLFQGQLRSCITCTACGYASVTFESFMFLSLPINARVTSMSLDECIRSYAAEEFLTGENRWTCPRCRVPRDARKNLRIWRMPPVLLVHLKRFYFSGPFRCKIQTAVRFPLTGLNLSPVMASADLPVAPYSLYGVANHFGELSGGHYTAMCRNPYDAMWYEFNDSTVTQVHPADVCSAAGYLLFYTSLDFRRSLPSVSF